MKGRPVRRFRFLKPYAIQNANGARGGIRRWEAGDIVTDRQLTPTDLAQMLRPPTPGPIVVEVTPPES